MKAWTLYYTLAFLSLNKLAGATYDFMIGHRREVEGFSLGPAPFPDVHDMDFELFGDAFIRDDAVKVTDAEQHQKGAIWSRRSFHLDENPDFQIDFGFRVGGSPNKDFFGDGFALWYIDRQQRGTGGDALGGPQRWNGLGIFFDTFKNHQMKGKRHPYVYAYVNDGTKDYNEIMSRDIEGQGCHIPFRNDESDVLDTTIARVTYKRGKVSVVLQPAGADDWVKCFVIEDVKLPVDSSVGVTAMTGDLVDNHHMVSINTYRRIMADPWDFAADNDIALMPDMWTDMKHSGEVARDFEKWERDIEDEIEFDLRDHYEHYASYYYHNDYANNDDEYHYDPYEEDRIQKEREREAPNYRNNYGEKKLNKDSRPKSKLTDKEIEELDRLISGTRIAQEINDLHSKRRLRMKKLRKHMEAEFRSRSEQMTGLIRTVRVKEYNLNKRIESVGAQMHVKVVSLFEQEQKAGGGWLWPFIFLFVLILGGAAFGWSKYKAHMKTHLL